jgi:CheY-like chemotaxis protein
MTGAPLRVVIADDHRVVRDGLVTILGAIDGVQVVGAARDGAEAVALAGQQDADVVLMDLRMPGMDGVEATRAVRAGRPGTAVVVLTTYTDDESILAALQAGAAGYLTKNASTDDIRRAPGPRSRPTSTRSSPRPTAATAPKPSDAGPNAQDSNTHSTGPLGRPPD